LQLLGLRNQIEAVLFEYDPKAGTIQTSDRILDGIQVVPGQGLGLL
jgi:hypothetical protein